MTYTNFDQIGLEDVEKKRGLISFGASHEAPKIEIEGLVPQKKKNKEEIIVQDGKHNRKRKGSGLF